MGRTAWYLPIDESHPRLSATVYGASKVAAEDFCFSFWRGFGVPVTILRFGATADAEELIDPSSVFARWLYLRAAIAHLESNPAPDPSVTASIEILRALDDGADHLVIFADAEGRPELRQWGDARDVARGCARVLEVPNAIGEVFNLGGVAPFASDALAQHLSKRVGLSCVTARLPIAHAPWYISSAKARGVLGYTPEHNVFGMVDAAAERTQNSASLAERR
jgi:nucleoside-diphosphate-sugar epimerase